VNRFLAIILVACVAGCLTYTQTDAIPDAGLDANTFYMPGTDTPLVTGGQVITFTLPDIAPS
jgi:hypothetical protein